MLFETRKKIESPAVWIGLFYPQLDDFAVTLYVRSTILSVFLASWERIARLCSYL